MRRDWRKSREQTRTRAYDPFGWNVVGAGSITAKPPFDSTLRIARPRSDEPSALKRKIPFTPAKPLGSVSASAVNRLYGVPGAKSATSDTAS